MKINCQSCGAKYTIADDKVRGRTVKIRCKKCNAAIVVNGAEAGEPDADEGAETRMHESSAVPGPVAEQSFGQASEWTVNLPSGEQCTVTIEQMRELLLTGQLNDESYVWRDGMQDWLPLGQIAELAELLNAASQQPPPAEEDEEMRTVIASPNAPPRPSAVSSPLAADARMAEAMSPARPEAARVQARRVEGRARNQDLFSEKAQPAGEVLAQEPPSPSAVPMPRHTFTAERGENSILFTIDAIRATAGKPAAKAAPKKKETKEEVVDFRQITSFMPSVPAPTDLGVPPNDIMSAPTATPLAQASLADLAVPPPPEPVPVAPAYQPPMQASAAMRPGATDDVEWPPKGQKSNKGLLFGLLGGAVVVGLAVVAVGYMALGKDNKDQTATAAASATATTTAAATETAAAAATTAEPAKAEPTAVAANDTAQAAAAEPKGAAAAAAGTAAKAMAAGTDPGLGKPGDKKPGDKKDDKKDDKKADKKDDKKDTPAPTPPPASGGGEPFNRGAAISALNAAAGSASGCKRPDGPTGRGRVSVTFASSGKVTTAVVSGPPFAGTSVGGCIAAAFRRATVPPFAGEPVTVGKSFSIE